MKTKTKQIAVLGGAGVAALFLLSHNSGGFGGGFGGAPYGEGSGLTGAVGDAIDGAKEAVASIPFIGAADVKKAPGGEFWTPESSKGEGIRKAFLDPKKSLGAQLSRDPTKAIVMDQPSAVSILVDPFKAVTGVSRSSSSSSSTTTEYKKDVAALKTSSSPSLANVYSTVTGIKFSTPSTTVKKTATYADGQGGYTDKPGQPD